MIGFSGVELYFFFFKQKTAYELLISDWSSDVCSSDLIFRAAGPAYRATHAGHLSLHQLKIMSAIEHCRTAALGGHVEACTDCGHWRIAYNSCRNRHCPRCQGAAARTWLEARE